MQLNASITKRELHLVYILRSNRSSKKKEDLEIITKKYKEVPILSKPAEEDKSIRTCTEYTHLGTKIEKTDRTDKEIEQRIR